MQLSERQRLVLAAALSYVHANVDDFNDTFCDPDDEDGKLEVRTDDDEWTKIDQVEGSDIAQLCFDLTKINVE